MKNNGKKNNEKKITIKKTRGKLSEKRKHKDEKHEELAQCGLLLTLRLLSQGLFCTGTAGGACLMRLRAQCFAAMHAILLRRLRLMSMRRSWS